MQQAERYRRPPGTLLDVGIGAGRLLAEALRAGWTERVAQTLLRLPLFYEISESQLDRVAESVTRFYARR